MVLCRGNADAMKEVLAFLERGVAVALTGGGDAMLRVARAAKELKAGKRTSHPELFLFTSWGEVQDYVEHDKAGEDLKAIVKLVDKYGSDKIVYAVERLSAEARLIYVAVTRARKRLDTKGIAWVDEYEQTMAATQPPLVTLPLTGQLRHDDSPVSRFMAQHAPRSLDVRRDYLSRLTALPHPVQPVDVRYPNWSALGHTIDYRLRLSFGATLGPAVSRGVDILADHLEHRGVPRPPRRHRPTLFGGGQAGSYAVGGIAGGSWRTLCRGAVSPRVSRFFVFVNSVVRLDSSKGSAQSVSHPSLLTGTVRMEFYESACSCDDVAAWPSGAPRGGRRRAALVAV